MNSSLCDYALEVQCGGIGGNGIDFAIEFLHQKVQAPPNNTTSIDYGYRFI